MAVSYRSDGFVSLTFRRSLSSLLTACAATTMAVEGALFQGLGFLSEPDAYSTAYGLSADGSTVVGGSAIGEFLWSYRWKDGVMTPIPKSSEADVPLSQGHAVSADGSVVVGMELDLTAGTVTGYRWSEAGGLVTLPYETGVVDNNYGTADVVSADGSVVAGSGPNAFRWTAADGITSIPLLPGGESGMSHVHGISGDGSTIVGASSATDGEFAFVWSEAEGTRTIAIPDASWSDAMGISADGSTIVGAFSVGASTSQTAFAWTAAGLVTMSSLSIEEGTISQTYALTSDGQWAVGVSNDLAALWDTRTGDVWDLNAFLAGQAAFAGWTLEDATGISANGLKIVGNGLNAEGIPEAWMIDLASIPEPSCGAMLALGIAMTFRRRRI
ncbi:hypothetical protein JIN84_14625 [Luteolibacter yonseiensis]|uniref:PEP-CTERM protein-sorting domain-containing protein n=1 Tax=Luteolibacter yonseiensis TaxID=1144680 RepID=A0A934R5P9_9BACT|nr:hypothetical protein [Luteolibacter yonseiensis]MBK1816857.1 hypothetical protein [Luteolibacter yonseiensis]